MKKLLLGLSLLLVSFYSIGQKKDIIFFNAGPQCFVATGKFMDTHNTGFGATLEGEILPHKKKKIGYFASSGYNYILGRGANQSLFHLPVLAGVRYHMDSTISIGQSIGVSFFNEDRGFRTTYSTSVRFDVGRLSIGCDMLTAVGHGNDDNIAGVVFRLGYKLNSNIK
jgi:hypothetical protein